MDRNTPAKNPMIGINKSLSARRAWIEMRMTRRQWRVASVALRKESVDRNAGGVVGIIGRLLSLSARRAWIEIFDVARLPEPATSLSARRAWIEIVTLHYAVDYTLSRSPQGERG